MCIYRERRHQTGLMTRSTDGPQDPAHLAPRCWVDRWVHTQVAGGPQRGGGSSRETRQSREKFHSVDEQL